MNIQINGKLTPIEVTSLEALITALELEKKSLVVEHNGAIIKQEMWDETTLSDGDVVELLNFVGGG